MTQQIRVLVREVLDETIAAFVKELVRDLLKEQVRELVKETVEIYTSSKALKVDQVMISYPWLELEIGKSFAAKKSDIKEQYLRNRASSVGKKAGRKFSVVNHKETEYFEVMRVR